MSDAGDNATDDESPDQSLTYPGNNSSRRKQPDSVHAEIEMLQRRFRQIEAQRKQSVVNLASARTPQLSRLKEISSQARDDLRLETGKAHSSIRYSMGQRVASLQDDAELYHAKIARESHRLAIVEEKIGRQRAILASQKKIAVQARQSKASVYHMEKRLLVDEGKLDSALVKFSEAISQNKTMRESIDDLRRERATFDTLVQRNERELEENKKELGVMMDQAVGVFQEKTRVATDLNQIRSEAMAELVKLEDEWYSLVRVLIEDAEQLEAALQEDMARAKEKKYDTSLDQMAFESKREHSVRQQLAGVEGRVRDHRNQIAEATLRVRCADETLAQIIRATGIGSIQDVVDTFLRAETANFYLFQRLSEINAQIDAEELEISNVVARQQAGPPSTANPSNLQSIVDDVYQNVQNVEARLQQYDAEIARYDDCMQVMKRSIERMLGEVVGETDAVHNGNIGICLDRIETFTNRYVNRYLVKKRSSDADRVRVVNVPALIEIEIDPPSVTLSSVDDDLETGVVLPSPRRNTSVGDEPALRRIMTVDGASAGNARTESAPDLLGPLFRRNRTPMT